jgi:Zn-dependent protease
VLSISPDYPQQNPRSVRVGPWVQLVVAVLCAVVVARLVDWQVAAQVFASVLGLFASINRPVPYCAQCGR